MKTRAKTINDRLRAWWHQQQVRAERRALLREASDLASLAERFEDGGNPPVKPAMNEQPVHVLLRKQAEELRVWVLRHYLMGGAR